MDGVKPKDLNREFNTYTYVFYIYSKMGMYIHIYSIEYYDGLFYFLFI